LMRIEALLAAKDDAVRASAARLVGAWKLERVLSKLHDRINQDSALPVRQAAINAIGEIGGPPAQIILGNEAPQSMNPAIRRMAIAALVGVDAECAGKFAATFLVSNPSAEDVTEVVSAFVQRKNGAETLAKALRESKLGADTAKVALRTMRASGRET